MQGFSNERTKYTKHVCNTPCEINSTIIHGNYGEPGAPEGLFVCLFFAIEHTVNVLQPLEVRGEAVTR